MTLRIDHCVLKGTVRNDMKNTIDGWLEVRSTRGTATVLLALVGNLPGHLAGQSLHFINHQLPPTSPDSTLPDATLPDGLQYHQIGVLGSCSLHRNSRTAPTQITPFTLCWHGPDGPVKLQITHSLVTVQPLNTCSIFPLATTPTHHQLNTPGNHTTALPRRTAESGPAAGTTTRLADPQTTAGSAGTGWHRFPPLPPLHQPRCPASDHPPNPAQTANRTPRQPKFGPPKLQLRRILHALPAGICRTTGPVVRRHPGKTSKSAKTALPSVGIRGSHLEFRNQQH